MHGLEVDHLQYATGLFYEPAADTPPALVSLAHYSNIWTDKNYIFLSLPLRPCHLVPKPEPHRMNNESTDLQVLLALRQQLGVAPLKNEKAGLLCCSQISPLLKNPIKRQKKVTFPFSVMTHGKRPLSGQRWGPLMRPVRRASTREERSYWLTEPALRLLHSVNHLQTLFFVALFSSGHRWSPVSRTRPAEPVPSFNFITAGLTARQQGGTNSILRPCMVTISWRHFSCRHLSSTPSPSLPFLLLCSYSITVSAFLRCPPRRAHKCSSAALITVWQTTVEGWRQLLTPVPSSPNSTPRLSRQGHPAAREREYQAANGGFHLPLLVPLAEVSCTYQDDGSGLI